MFTLTNASKDTKSIIKWLIILIVLGLIGYGIFRIAILIKDTLYPPPPVTAEKAFGKLPPPNFVLNAKNNDLTYSINTISGFIPSLPNLGNVYKFTTNKPDLLGLQNTENTVQAAGFISDKKQIDGNIYEWNSLDKYSLVRTIKINILSHTFQVTSDFYNDPDVLAAENLPDQKKAIATATDFLNSLGGWTDTLNIDGAKTQLLRIDNQQLTEATSISNTQIIKVNLFPTDIDGLTVFPPNPNEANVNLLVSGGKDMPQVIYANYITRKLGDSSTYSIKDTAKAIEELKNGKAYIASYNGVDKNISITDIMLGYYDSGKEEQEYLTPIIVFKGSNNFYAYINAITDEEIDK